MTDKQPEALRLANAIDLGRPRLVLDCIDAAAELRRLHDVETKYHESVGGFKRDLAEKLEQQRKKNTRLTDELRRLEKDYVVRDADLRRLHEVNAELVKALRECTAWMEYLRASGDAGNWEWEADEYTRAIAAIAKVTGEQQ
jgi:hypothetical protein